MKQQRLSGEPKLPRRPSKSGRRQRITQCAGCGRDVYVCCAYGSSPYYHWECWPHKPPPLYSA